MTSMYHCIEVTWHQGPDWEERRGLRLMTRHIVGYAPCLAGGAVVFMTNGENYRTVETVDQIDQQIWSQA